MKEALARLSEYVRGKGIRVYLAMVPDVHNLVDYPFGYAHDIMAKVALEHGFQFVDLYPPFEGLTPNRIWSISGDPHPNSLGHRLMAESLYPVLAQQMQPWHTVALAESVTP